MTEGDYSVKWRHAFIAALLPFLAAIPAAPESLVDGRRSVVLESETARVVVDVLGGSIVRFELKNSPLNPLVWGNTGSPSEARPIGHFLCLDRWGQPSDAELKNGMPFHGEATRVEWKVLQEPASPAGAVAAELSASLPMAGLDVRRAITLSSTGAFFRVTEEVTNRNQLGRIYNMVQHPTIGPPFLDENTVVDSNARKGFMQSSPLPNPEEPAVSWPQALKDSQPVNMRELRDDPQPNVVSYTIDEEYGWATASNATKGLLIGYIWPARDYPWFNAWREVRGGKPLARGLEFGTTGLHQPFPVLVRKGRIFGRSLYVHIDTGEKQSRSYAAFLFSIPNDYRGVQTVTYAEGRITLQERPGGRPRQLTVDVGNLW
jgi:hypothetical protein